MTFKTFVDLMGSKFVEPKLTERVIATVEIERTRGSFLIAGFGSKCPEERRKMFTERNGKEALSLAFRDTRKKRRKRHQMIAEFPN